MDLLDQVKLALKAGDIDQLNRSAAQQNRLLDQLERSGGLRAMPEKKMRLLAKTAEQNQRLLKAALAGLKAASRRKSDIQEARKATLTYDRTGRRNRLEPGTTALERRS